MFLAVLFWVITSAIQNNATIHIIFPPIRLYSIRHTSQLFRWLSSAIVISIRFPFIVKEDGVKNRDQKVSRRDFIKMLSAVGTGALLASCGGKKILSTPQAAPIIPTATRMPTAAAQGQAVENELQEAVGEPTSPPTGGQAYLSVARGTDPAALTMAALAALGGIERFVKRGYNVIIKPNICTDYYSYEYGATTNPTVIATLVQLCQGAGAGRVRVMDMPFGGSPQSAYAKSGIADAVESVGGEMEIMNRHKFVEAEIPDGLDIKKWDFYKEILDADLVIDVPIAKDHGTTRLSLGAKNMLGVITNPGGIHANIHQRIADLTSLVRPKLTVVDAIRTLMSNGPTGGNLDDVRMTNTIIASHDIVAADAYATTLFGMQPQDIGFIQACAAMGLGTMDLNAIQIEEVNV